MTNAADRSVVIFGAGELAQLAHFYFTHDAARRVAGFTVDAKFVNSSECQGLPLVPFEEVEHHFPPRGFDLFVAIGYTALNVTRARRCADATARGYRLATYISSRASTWPDLVIGDNCLIMEGNVIQPFVRVGHNVVMFCSSLVSHHVEIGDNCFIGSEATICGGVRIGANSFIGVNATIREHLNIGSDCIIGAGTLILQDTADGSGYIGNGTADSGIPSRRLQSLL